MTRLFNLTAAAIALLVSLPGHAAPPAICQIERSFRLDPSLECLKVGFEDDNGGRAPDFDTCTIWIRMQNRCASDVSADPALRHCEGYPDFSAIECPTLMPGHYGTFEIEAPLGESPVEGTQLYVLTHAGVEHVLQVDYRVVAIDKGGCSMGGKGGLRWAAVIVLVGLTRVRWLRLRGQRG